MQYIPYNMHEVIEMFQLSVYYCGRCVKGDAEYLLIIASKRVSKDISRLAVKAIALSIFVHMLFQHVKLMVTQF